MKIEFDCPSSMLIRLQQIAEDNKTTFEKVIITIIECGFEASELYDKKKKQYDQKKDQN